MKIIRLLLIAFLMAFPFASNSVDIVKCKDKHGHTVFTQNSAICKSSIETQSYESVKKTAADKKTVNYRYPQRSYISVKGKWNIFVEKNLKEGNNELYNSSLAKLNLTLDHVFSVMPENARKKLSNLRFFLLWGEKSPLGGRNSGMSYIRQGEPNHYKYLDKRWEHAIIIYSAENLMYLNQLWSQKAVFHELSHAWHIVNWPERHPPIYEAWKATRNTQRFTNIRDIKGKKIKSAYARKNQLEYFAELSAMYFVGGNYYPYDRAGLKKYDVRGYRMVEMLWN